MSLLERSVSYEDIYPYHPQIDTKLNICSDQTPFSSSEQAPFSKQEH